MYVEGELEATESKRAALRHAPVERLFDAGSDGEGPRRAVVRANPHEIPLTLPSPPRGRGVLETA